MRDVKALLNRPDPSKTYLNTYKSQGYITVVFVANMEADPDCEYLNGNVYNIDELLALDNPIYRMSHPNCRCKFNPLDKGQEPTYTNQTTTEPITTTTTPTTTESPVGNEQVPEEKNPWYKKWAPWLFKNKQKSNFRARILKRAHDEKNRRSKTSGRT